MLSHALTGERVLPASIFVALHTASAASTIKAASRLSEVELCYVVSPRQQPPRVSSMPLTVPSLAAGSDK